MRVVEIGTFTGASAIAMLDPISKADGHLFCVDWFRGNIRADGTMDANDMNAAYSAHDILATFRQNLRRSGSEHRVSIIVGRSLDVAPIISDHSIDAIFLDADHRYSAVKADIAAWLPKIKLGGVMFGHDFECHLRECDRERAAEMCEEDFVDGRHYGVIRAVGEAFPNVERRGRIWVATKGA